MTDGRGERLMPSWAHELTSSILGSCWCEVIRGIASGWGETINDQNKPYIIWFTDWLHDAIRLSNETISNWHEEHHNSIIQYHQAFQNILSWTDRASYCKHCMSSVLRGADVSRTLSPHCETYLTWAPLWVWFSMLLPMRREYFFLAPVGPLTCAAADGWGVCLVEILKYRDESSPMCHMQYTCDRYGHDLQWPSSTWRFVRAYNLFAGWVQETLGAGPPAFFWVNLAPSNDFKGLQAWGHSHGKACKEAGFFFFLSKLLTALYIARSHCCE